MNSYTGILHLYFFEMSGKEIHKAFYPDNTGIIFRRNEIPNFAISELDKSIVDSDGYFQFIENDDNNKFILFDYECSDYIISEEIGNVGLLEFLNGFTILPFDYDKININKWDTRQIPVPTLFKVKITYNSYYDHEGNYDCDIEIKADYLIL